MSGHLAAAAIDWGKGPADRGASVAPREFRTIDETRYTFTLFDVGLTFEIDRLRRRFEELVGELVVRCRIPGARTIGDSDLLSAGDFNLSSIRARQERADLLSKRSETPTIDWFGLLEDFCARVLAADRAGQPAVHLRDLDPPGPDQVMDIEGVRLLQHHPTILFGDGGCGKSLLALYLAGRLAYRDVRTLLVDWEFSGADHRERLQRVFGVASMPDLLYARADKPLSRDVDRLRRIIRDEGVQFIVCDSIGFACGGPPESAEMAAEYFRALRSLDVGSLHVAHVNRSDQADQKPFGSIYWHNGARATWFVSKAEESAAGDRFTIGLFPKKSNTGPLGPAIGFEVAFTPERITIQRSNLADSADFAAKVPPWQRMASLLRSGPLPLDVIAEALDAKPDTIKRTVNRSQGRTFVRVEGSDGKPRISLVERRSA